MVIMRSSIESIYTIHITNLLKTTCWTHWQPDLPILIFLIKKQTIFFNIFAHFLRNFKPDPSSGLVTVAKSNAMKLLLKLLPANPFIKKLSENSKTYCKEETDYVGNFTAYTKMLCHKRVFSEFITAEFEGKHYRIPVGYDEWLRCFYGDYMQLPPEEERTWKHHPIIIDLEHNYEEL